VLLQMVQIDHLMGLDKDGVSAPRVKRTSVVPIKLSETTTRPIHVGNALNLTNGATSRIMLPFGRDYVPGSPRWEGTLRLGIAM
jgi:hypothetical protein